MTKAICFWGRGWIGRESTLWKYAALLVPANPKSTLRPWHLTKRATEVPTHPQPSLKSNLLLSLRQYFHGDNRTGSTRLLWVETCIFGNLPLVPRFRAPALCHPLPSRLTPSPVAQGAPDAGWQQRVLAASAFLPGPDCRARRNTSFIGASDHRNAAEVHLTKPKGFSQRSGVCSWFLWFGPCTHNDVNGCKGISGKGKIRTSKPKVSLVTGSSEAENKMH